MSSIIPGSIAEARTTKVHVSLALVIALTGGAFYAGRSSPPPEQVAELAKQNERNAANQAATAAQLTRVAEALDKQAQTLRDLQELARTTNTEMQFVSSHYKAPGNQRR